MSRSKLAMRRSSNWALLCTQAENLRLEVMIWRRHETSGALLWLQEAMRDIEKATGLARGNQRANRCRNGDDPFRHHVTGSS
jgi:hypothetical protein